MKDLDGLLKSNSSDSGSDSDSNNDLADAASGLVSMFSNIPPGVPLSPELVGSVANLADKLGDVLGGAEADSGKSEAEKQAEKKANQKALLDALTDALAQNTVPGEPPIPILGESFARSIMNAIIPIFDALDPDEPFEVELDKEVPAAAFAPKVNNSDITANYNVSDAEAVILNPISMGGSATAVLIVGTINGDAGNEEVMVADQASGSGQAAEVQASEGSLPQKSPPPPAYSSGSAATSLSVSTPDARRRRLRPVRRLSQQELRRQLEDGTGPKCATAYVKSANAKTDARCLPAYYEVMACASLLNETFVNLTAQQELKKSSCDGVSSFNEKDYQKCLTESDVLLVMEEVWKNQSIICQNISMPCSGPDRGECNITADVCMCNPDWIGLQCENQPSAVVTTPGGLSNDGIRIGSMNPNTGASLLEAGEPADMSIMTETVEPPPMKTSGAMKVNLPKMMTLEELLETLADMSALEFIIPISWFLFMIICFKLCFKYDDSKAYVSFFPSWHSCLTGGNSTSTLCKVIGAQLLVVLLTNPYAMIFFILPTLPFGRAQRLLCTFLILHAKLAVLALFYGGQEAEWAVYAAQAIDIAVGVFFQQIGLQCFMFALIKSSDLSAVQAQVEKKMKLERSKMRWVLAFRQTVPASKARAAEAMASWRGDDVLLLQNKAAPQYYDGHTLLRKVEDFRFPDGTFTLMLKMGKRGGTGGRSMVKSTSVWKQSSALNAQSIEGFQPIKVHRLHKASLKGLRQGSAATWDDDAEGVHVELAPTDHAAAPILTGGAGEDRTPVFQLGCPELNRSGGITGWAASFAGTVHKVELYVQNPHFKGFHKKRTLVDKARGRNKLPPTEPLKDPAHIERKAKPKPKLKPTTTEKVQKALRFVGSILNKATEVPEGLDKKKLKRGGMINKVKGVPACAMIRQPDGSVGFFVETCDDPNSAVVRSRVEPAAEAAARREIMANKELQIKHVAKRLMTTMDAIDFKFEEASRALSQSGGKEEESALSELRSQRDNDMMDLEAQARATLAFVERETAGKLARRDKESVPAWVSTLLKETTAWQLLYPGRVKKQGDDCSDDGDDDSDDDGTKKGPAGSSVTSWPKFVRCVALAKKPPPSSCKSLCTLEQMGTYKATYVQEDLKDGPVELDKIILTPMLVHRNLCIHYQKRMVEGWSHENAMDEIHKFCGLPIVWRGCQPFTGSFDPVRLRRAWIICWSLWFLLLAWLAWSFLSLRELLPWGGIIGTMFVGILLEPGGKIGKSLAIGFAVFLILEGPSLYVRFIHRNNPDFDEAAYLQAKEDRQKELDQAADADADASDEDDENVKKPEKQTPAATPMVSACALVAIAGPDKQYEAMQTGAALRELDKRKHQETAAVARRLVPKLDAETRRHEGELALLDQCRAACTDSVAIETLDAQKIKMESAHAVALKEIEADAMLALANVERAHDRAIESITSTSTICEPAYRSLVQSESQQETLEEPQRNEAAETAKLVEHQQAAMKIVAQHMIQQVDSVTANHEVRMSRLKEQLAGLGHALMEDKMARRAIESQIKESERAHTEQLKSLEEKASVALSHVESQHQQAVANLRLDFPQASSPHLPGGAGDCGSNCVKPTDSSSLGSGGGESLPAGAAEAMLEWSQLEDEKKAMMRAEAQRLMAEMHKKQEMHDRVMAAAQERVEHATTDVARALFTDDIRLHEEHHAKELQELEAQATQALATIDRDFSSRGPALPPVLSATSSQAFYGSAKRMASRDALELASHSQRIPVPQSEARMQAITWLDGQERNSERDSEDGKPSRQASSVRVRVGYQKSAVRVGNSAAANRARAVRQAYETLGVDRNIADSALDRMYVALLDRENPENNPSDCAVYYAKKTKEIRAAYACVRSNRHPGAVQSRATQNLGADLGV
jgi:hypothetical protein